MSSISMISINFDDFFFIYLIDLNCGQLYFMS